jgi:hypothetical protein
MMLFLIAFLLCHSQAGQLRLPGLLLMRQAGMLMTSVLDEQAGEHQPKG